MILYMLFFCLLGESMALNKKTAAGNGSSCFAKSVMCYINGHMCDSSSELVNLDPKNIPCECEVIIYSRFLIDTLSVIDVDETFLKSVTDLNRPVMLTLARDGLYTDWGTILGPDGNAKDTQVLCDFAIKNKISGYLIEGLAPQCDFRPFDHKVARYIIPYIKQLLKCSADLKIGVAVDCHGSSIKNPCLFNFEELNGLVTFYEIQTYGLNQCKPSIYNGMSPITKSKHGDNYTYGMEEVVSQLKESKISTEKIIFDIEMFPVNIDSSTYSSYSQVCKGGFNHDTWCVQTTKNFYDKGKFALEQDSGIMVKILDLDDIQNDCGCSSKFAGFHNIIAGFRGGSQTPCAKFDVQSTRYSVD